MANIKLTRNQLASFLKDHEQIKQFERLFDISNSSVTVDSATLDPGDFIYWDGSQWLAKAPEALTRINDTNVTLSFAGTPASSLFNSVSMTLGWTGTLAVARGGTGGGAASGTLLDNITGFSSTGHLVRTGAGTYAFRTQTGTANRIDVTNGTGVAGNPTFDISATYVGQASITTLGTIATGTWQATTIGVSYGGTGTNTTFTAGSVVFAGASGIYAQDNANLFFDDTNNRLGVGTASPADLLHVDNGRLISQRYAAGGAIILRRADGTQGSPAAVAAASGISAIVTRGYDGTTYRDVAAIQVLSDGAISSSSSPGYLLFQTTPSGSTTALDRIRIESTGQTKILYNFARGAPVTKTADFTVADTENWLINNKAGSTCTVTFPAASGWVGREIMIKTIQAQTVVSASSDVVPLAGGAAGTAILAATAGRWATLVSDGTNWIIMQAA